MISAAYSLPATLPGRPPACHSSYLLTLCLYRWSPLSYHCFCFLCGIPANHYIQLYRTGCVCVRARVRVRVNIRLPTKRRWSPRRVYANSCSALWRMPIGKVAVAALHLINSLLLLPFGCILLSVDFITTCQPFLFLGITISLPCLLSGCRFFSVDGARRCNTSRTHS